MDSVREQPVSRNVQDYSFPVSAVSFGAIHEVKTVDVTWLRTLRRNVSRDREAERGSLASLGGKPRWPVKARGTSGAIGLRVVSSAFTERFVADVYKHRINTRPTPGLGHMMTSLSL